jgi:hypothetical protein
MPGWQITLIAAAVAAMLSAAAGSAHHHPSQAFRPTPSSAAPIEFDLHSARSLPSTPLVGQVLSWLGEAFTRAGIDPALGPDLWAVLQAAGLQPLGMIGVQPHFGPEDPDGAAILAGIVKTVLPLIERTGVATAAEVGADTLQQRLSGELAASAAVSLIQC